MSPLTAFIIPFIAFMLLLGISQGVHALGTHSFWLQEPKYWIYPVQTFVCAGLLARGWRYYELRRPKGVTFTIFIALLVLVLWISPQAFFHAPPRSEGFDPFVFHPGSAIYWMSLSLRFIRLAVIVPLLEEIFWRGFLLRYLIKEDFLSVPFGSFSWLSFAGVSICFGLEHSGADFFPAVAAGALYNVVAIRTRSLSSCVLAHAITNLLLGVYICCTKQWGFW